MMTIEMKRRCIVCDYFGFNPPPDLFDLGLLVGGIKASMENDALVTLELMFTGERMHFVSQLVMNAHSCNPL